MTLIAPLKRSLVIAAVGGALCVAAAGPASAASVGLLKVSQLPTGYKATGAPVSISGSSIAKGLKGFGGGAGSFALCKGSPSAASLHGVTAHAVGFGKTSGKSVSILAEIVLETPSPSAAAAYFSAVQRSTAKCTVTENLKIEGSNVRVTYGSHHVSINKAGADQAVGTVLALSGRSKIDGVASTFKGSIGVQLYRKGSKVVELLVDDFGVKVNDAKKSLALTFSPGSMSLDTSIGKAAIKDL